MKKDLRRLALKLFNMAEICDFVQWDQIDLAKTKDKIRVI